MLTLAIDIGASGGRHILGRVEGGRLITEEIYRFRNGMKREGAHLVWDPGALFKGVIDGLKKCRETGRIPDTVAIDTWGVDYVLLDGDKRLLSPVFAYRDGRTAGIPEEVDAVCPRDELFRRNGIQPLAFNSLYQLLADKKAGRLKDARYWMMIPDYLSYELTGIIANEYTNATTGALVLAEQKDWDRELMTELGIDPGLFQPLSRPATPLGRFTRRIEDMVGFSAEVIHAASHDTASAVAACPLDGESVYISSGTWSLIGTECARPVLDPAAGRAGFTNEGGVEGRYRFLENVMGMWLFQNLRRDLGGGISYDDMMKMAEISRYEKTVDPNDGAFTAPESMLAAVKAALGEKDLPTGDLLRSVYLSLAASYRKAVETVERFSGKTVKNVFIVGGGSKDAFLNELTARATGKRVLTGLEEATATGNILAQIMAKEGIDLTAARRIVRNSITIKETGI
ncbi:MAG: rhamnulokinase [Clostridia bacterium]|nr:rhamnulokinase [Clostridia bacterium]